MLLDLLILSQSVTFFVVTKSKKLKLKPYGKASAIYGTVSVYLPSRVIDIQDCCLVYAANHCTNIFTIQSHTEFYRV